ncbi:Protein NRT1/ PTR FAMILY 5.6 [Glycine soja]
MWQMEKRNGGRIEENKEKWVHDASVDYKGRVPLRASTAIEFSERVSYFGIASNLISYLTKVMHEDLSTASKNVNYWSGTTTLMPLVGGFVADAYTGRFYMVLFSSFVYLMGLSLLTMSQFIPSLMPCNTKMCQQPRKVHKVVFLLALYCISFGTGGYKPCLESFGADQFDDDHLEERKKKMSFFNWWSFALCFALLLGATVVVYVQDFVSWGVATLILAILMALTVIAFCVGKPFYRYRRAEGNPLTPILQVLIAAIRKRNLTCPSNPALLHEVPESERSQGRLLSHTNRLRFLDKAAIIEEKHFEQKYNPWRLATVTRVEETKLVLNIIPIWLTSLTVGVCVGQGQTLFVKQAAATNLKISDSFKIPPASMASVAAVGTLIAVPIYDRVVVPILRKVTGNERGISILRRISIGMTLSVLLMVVAALTMSVMWLIPQYLILGIGDSFSLVGLQEYFYDQVPDSMRSIGMALYLSVLGVGFFLCSFLIIIVEHITGKTGNSWIGKDINSSRLDKFYWMLAVINALVFCVFLLVSKRYTYKAVQRRAMETDCCKSDEFPFVKMEQEMEKRNVVRIEENEEKWVHDASVDYKGRVPLRASTGVWKASLFVLTIELSERVSYFGIATNLISYLTKVMHEDLQTAAKSVNYWSGTTTLMPLVGGFVADAYTGRFYMILFSSFVYLMGLSLLTMSQFIPSLKPCNNGVCHRPRKVHEVVFFLALYCISFGTGGYKPCLESFGADQFDDDHLEERKKKMSFFNWWNFAMCFALLLGATVVVYVQDFVSWGVATLIVTILMTLTVIAFCMGKRFYRYRRTEGNPLTPILQVLIAAMRKRNLSCRSNPALLHEVPESERSQGRLLSHTNRLRFLDKAAIIEEKRIEQKYNPWRLATVTRVEETKLVLNIIPIWLTSLTVGVTVGQGQTLFVKQAAATNLKLSHSFKIPPASMASVTAVGTLIAVPIYDRITVPIMRKFTGNERGISILRRISIGMALSVIVMVVAALVEGKRLRMATHEVLNVGETRHETMSVVWLIPQYLILGVGDSFSLVGLQEYFYSQVPDSMRSLGMALYLSVLGVGFFLSSFLIIIVDRVTGKTGNSWIGKDINSSRLDRFYWMLAVINALVLCVFLLVIKRYTYKAVQRRAIETDCCKSDGVEMTLPGKTLLAL